MIILAATGKLTMVKYLISLGVDLQKRGVNQHTALHFAAAIGKKEVVQYLLLNGAELTAKDVDGNTPLHLSTHHLSIVQLFCQKGADIVQKNNYGFTVAHCAAIDDNSNTLSFLASQQIYVNHEPSDQLACLNQAILFRNEKKLHLFLESTKEDDDEIFTHRDSDGNGFLHCAVGFGCLEIAETFIKCSTWEELHALNTNGYAPIHLAVFRKNGAEIIRFLAKRKIDTNLKDQSGKTALEYAIKFDNVRAVRTLLRYGAIIPLSYIETQYMRNVTRLDRLRESLALLRPLVWQLSISNIKVDLFEIIYCRIFDNCNSSTLKNLRQTNRNTCNIVDKYLSNRWKVMKPQNEYLNQEIPNKERAQRLKDSVNLMVAFGLFAPTPEERQSRMNEIEVPPCVIQ